MSGKTVVMCVLAFLLALSLLVGPVLYARLIDARTLETDDLRARIEQLEEYRHHSSQTVMALTRRSDEVGINHNKLVERVQQSFNMQGYDISLISRALRNTHGARRWERNVAQADAEFKKEAVKTSE